MPEPYRYRLLFVGVNTPCDGPPLQAAVRDAEALSDRFRGWGYVDPARHHLLVGAQATVSNVLEHLADAAAEPDLDLLLVYWAGPMLAKGRAHVFATACDPDAGPVTLPLETLTDTLAAAPAARHRVLILDTCTTTALSTPEDETAPHLGRLTRFASAHADVAVLAVSAPDALRREHHRRGYLTGALLEQLCPGAEPPKGDVLAALRAAADRLTGWRQQPVLSIAETMSPLHLPALHASSDVTARVLAMPARHPRRAKLPAARTA